MSAGEVFRIPQIILIPAMLISCALTPLSLLDGSIPANTTIAAILAAIIFSTLVVFVLVIPALNAFTLKQNGIDGTATIIRKELRARILITPDYRGINHARIITFEFIPQGTSASLRLEAEVEKVYSKLTEGKSAKIRYAASNPRIVKFIGEYMDTSTEINQK